ncbi:MAG: acyl carrier protein [Isosphaeraceae bacterium]|nr:acyl carrier protein [Isosphaeraceae bacterium]
MVDREAIRQSLRTYLEDDLGEALPAFDDGVNLREGLGLDSVDVVGLVMQVERQLRIRLATEELVQLVTVGDLLDLLLAKTSERPAPPPDDGTKDAA